MTVEIAFDTYHTYDAMTAHLHELAEAYPQLCTLTSIAKTFRGRDVWFMTITNPETGPALEKPGFYIDAQIHAEEHATSATALYACWYLLTNYGRDNEVTRLVDTQVFYIIPRINPDGAEYALTAPYHPWCGNGRCLPGEDRIDGLIPQDINGDGYIVQMRVPDPKGEWKKDAADPRILVQREPGEEGGEYFRLYPEGLIENYDGVHVQIDPQEDGNMNRNFPINWSPREYGAGDYPFSEPEAFGMGQVILNHPNIAGMCAYHTHGGIILRPSMMKMDADMSPRDLALYKDLGAVGERLTGYPTISTYEDFTPDKSKARHGSLKDWVYEEMGIICFSTELWDLERTAGVPKVGYYNLYPRDDETTRKVFNWVVENVGDHGFREWEPFDHPQLGPVEVGGMVYIWSYRNPPGHLLEEICHNNVMFNLRHAAAAPRVLIDEVSVEPLGADLHKVTAVVSNHGYLPTNLSDVAVENGVARPVVVSLECDGAELAMNPADVALGNLAGRNERKYAYSNWGQQWSPVTKKVEWLVKSQASGGSVTIVAASQKGGTSRQTVTL
ncbi:peptidase M14 [Ponticoccus sp. SC2-23]|uniref:M14 family metallopeptidase n=1 Tax=Alexandriicola marinus TaxID=2081710 RepID=UPI000FDC2967|nr:M14 family metallopeptidase [Alexandriicola marinus]MBM1219778.1 peptidase M14 [Ponticoccus sp. SC6-9]MBM1223150.1 peptidase M14 [Ponticoccus sp. SC6-15]MBM1229591.1 peptidase M14 [Ponticoccus sp. SC6-38]MBM1232116.1 peptidase M14 [Ponticoccus sp. SC6-45]MBM1237934.1 peptidase M14 [Ponticoccus sp. SC6-49]MBM1241127.1 peptidase M14 [Ponticoccus sp. SC2-64]MBM1245640.1 peptidase M14 [Ponticoccus sp. SC6-42]MBM1250118.1 peptidase M14 [Ponticoccus sp. SC6-33]MBM1255943.1 peptidase M14 [Pont